MTKIGLYLSLGLVATFCLSATAASRPIAIGHVVMQNAFGAAVDTSNFKQRSLNLVVQDAPLSFPVGTVWKDKSLLGIPGLEDDDVGLGLPVFMAPTAAKRVTKEKSLGLIIGFSVADLAGAQRERSGSGPSFSAPVGIISDTSKLPVHITSLAVLDRSTKIVRASWTNR